MLAKLLMINPHHPLLNPNMHDQKMVITADKEALLAIAKAATEAAEGEPDETGGAQASIEVSELEMGQSITYTFLRVPEELLRLMQSDKN